MIDFADVLDVICADGNFEILSTHTPICIFLFPILKVTDRRNLIQFLGLVLRPLGVSLGYCDLKEVSSSYLLSRTQYSFRRGLGFRGKFSATRCIKLPDFSLRTGQGELHGVG